MTYCVLYTVWHSLYADLNLQRGEQTNYMNNLKNTEASERKRYSNASPTATVNSVPSMSFQRNEYQRDIFKAAADKLNVSVNQFIREAALEKAVTIGIS